MSTVVERLKGWKTRIFAGLLAVLGLLSALGIIDPAQSAGFQEAAEAFWGGALIAIGAVVAILRQISDGPAGG